MRLRRIITVLLAAVLAAACPACAPAAYTVRFETFGGSEYAPVTGEAGGLIDEPMMPVNGNKSFEGWYCDEACTRPFDFSAPIRKDTTVYAKWLTRYNVNYYYNGEILQRRKVAEGSAAERITYLSGSLEVTDWYTEADLLRKYDFTEPVTGDLNLYAFARIKTKWEFPADINVGTGWIIQADTTDRAGSITALEDGMRVDFDDPSAWDTYLRSPELSIPNLSDYKRIVIRYKNLSAQKNLKVYFFRTTDLVWDGKGENFPILETNMSETDAFATATIEIANTATLSGNWTGTLWLLRFEVKQADGDIYEQPAGSSFILQSIALEK